MEFVEVKDSFSYFMLKAKHNFNHQRLEDARVNIFCYVQDRRYLHTDQQTLFRDIFEYRINHCRNSIKNLCKGFNRELTSNINKELLMKSIFKLKKEIQRVCLLTEELITTELLPYNYVYDDRIFYTIIQGDCFRIMSQVIPNEVTDVDLKMCFFAYHCAYNCSIDHLDPTSELRITAGLKLALYYYIVSHNRDKAKNIYKKVFDSVKQYYRDDETKIMIAKCKVNFFNELEFNSNEKKAKMYKFFENQDFW